ncbi:MAG: lipoyl(octanoyl) transferase LipB [Gammaproteobacteria bacterium]|nr:lipoyl(octanoyl) transferase LipB [Gammaproteobacteria bacterium]MDH5652435.1 lipoyl(octanoyl) transferase LipB [Gammaproteobacteria bacterium]
MSPLIIRELGRREYLPVYHAMQNFNAQREANTADEIWLVEHPPVFTQGLNGKPQHLLDPGAIPVIPVDRGGQVTYHGPGQLTAYLLLDLKRLGLGVRGIVSIIETAIIQLLAEYGISAQHRPDAPGVYVAGAKIAALGLRIRRGCSYHGLSLNVDMDLTPFSLINPCGYPGLSVTQLRTLGVTDSLQQVADRLTPHLARQLGYNERQYLPAEALMIDGK